MVASAFGHEWQHLVQRLQAPELDFHVRRRRKAVRAQAPAVRRRLDAGAVALSALLSRASTASPSEPSLRST